MGWSELERGYAVLLVVVHAADRADETFVLAGRFDADQRHQLALVEVTQRASQVRDLGLLDRVLGMKIHAKLLLIDRLVL